MATADQNVRQGIGVVGNDFREVRNVLNANTTFTYQLAEQTKNIIADAGNSNTEIVAARTDTQGLTYTTVGDRLDAEEITFNDQLTKKADQTYVDTVLSNVLDGSPTATFNTLSALKSAYPNGVEGVFLVLENGHIYFWNGTNWEDGGVYQGIQLKDQSVTTAAIATNAVSLDKLKNIKTVGIVVGKVTIDQQTQQLIATGGAQVLFESNNGTLTMQHVTDAPSYLDKSFPLQLSTRGRPNVILLNMATLIFEGIEITVFNDNFSKYQNEYRLFGVLYNDSLMMGDPDNGFKARIVTSNGTTYPEGKIFPGTIIGHKLGDYTIPGIKLANGTVDAVKFYPKTITEDKVADEAVNTRLLKNDNVTTNKLAPKTMPRNYPLAGHAKSVRSRDGYGKVNVGDIIHQLFFYSKYDRYYIQALYGRNTANGTRQIVIREKDGRESFTYTAQPTYDAQGNFVYPENEYCELKDNLGAVKGYAVISWAATFPVADYAFEDTELHASCFLNINKLSLSNIDYGLRFQLEKDYVAVVGRELNMYFDNFVALKFPSDVYYKVTSSTLTSPSIKHFDECIRINPTTQNIGQHTINVQVIKFSTEEVVGSAQLNLKVVEDTTLSTEIKAIFIGDSLTESTYIQNTAKDMFGQNFILYGTRGTAPYLHEGRSGWASIHYLNNQDYKGITNSFYNPNSGGFDFAYYIEQNPTFADVNVVNIFLGRNDEYKNPAADRINQMIANIKSYNPDIIITVMMAYQTGKTNAGTGQYMQNTWEFNIIANRFNDYARTVFGNRESEGIYLIPQYINLDTVYDYPHTNRSVSERNPELVYRITDNVHPNEYGYQKFADVWYNHMKDILNM
ncbi:SGNH/GDSL hydrolase family protein [Terribacillus saccharophilus]|uniref:SGNH/GDSL hydrolase family protein n=1 Tax=Terribacillus saccharophilus TaxID=361277 RepID=UPI000BA6CA92|nr:GDSL-type esterase/lipase family protein [Terribacillus saccharophilus]PAF19761.1 hypothetical protein CHH51_01480 [Terribacillus saccharophilus]